MDKHNFINDYLQGKHPIEENSWELPTADELDRDEALFESLMAERKVPSSLTPRPERELKRRVFPLSWRGVGGGLIAACVAGFIAISLAPPRESNKEAEQQPVVTEVVEQEIPQPVIAEPAPEPIAEEKQQEPIKLHKAHKPHKPQEPKEESLLAEVETTEEAPTEIIQQRHIDSSNPYLLATAQLQDLRSRGERLDREVAMLMQH